ncbi:MAG: uroporphyrinogen-III synthase [Steroidobacteraceae bacterium]
MIPAPTPALTGLTVLVTRPADSGASLCRKIASLGGDAIPLPALVIEGLTEPVTVSTDPEPGPHPYDVVVFVSPNAVTHGLKAIARTPDTVIAAIGKSTAAALTAAGAAPAIVPEAGFTSEALLAHPGMQADSLHRVLIVRGGGGREVLEEALVARGIEVDYLEVYRRVPAELDDTARGKLLQRWRDGGIEVVTATSGEILTNLHRMLGVDGQALLAAATILVVSPRLADAARALGCHGEILVAPAADDDSLAGMLARWRTRARTQ